MSLRLLVYALAGFVAAAPVAGDAQAPTYQGALPASITAPRKVASSPEGELYAADAEGRLYRLTRRGAMMGKLLENVVSVAGGPGVVFAGTRDGAVVQLDARTGRVLRKMKLGSHEPPAALAFDALRGKLWIAFESGMLQARTVEGAPLHHVPPATGQARFVGLTIDAAGMVWVAQDRTGAGGTLHAYDPETGNLVRSAPVTTVSLVGGVSAASGRMYVSDPFGGKLQAVGPDGALGGTLGTRGTEAGQLSEPAGMAVAGNGDVVVANMNANRLDRFGAGVALPTCAGDADCDGLPDAWELANGLDPNDPANAYADLDRDGLNAAEELALGTNPRSKDTDGDGYSDGQELASGFDPLDPDDHRPRVVVDGPKATDPGYVRLSATVRDPTGERSACTVTWKQTSGTPAGLKVTTSGSASFVARGAGKYGFEASGTCGGVAAVPARLEVAVNNVAPRADGGRVVTLLPGGVLDLSAQFSADANGDALAFQWDQVVGAPVLAGVAGKSVAVNVPAPGYYVFRLGAADGAGAEGAAEVPVLVLGDVPAPTAVASTPVRAHAGETVTLDASASYTSGAASFSWRQVEGEAVVLGGAGAERATFVAARPGRYAFEVAVEEAGMRSPPARVEVFAAASGGELPVARASAPATAAVDVPVTLDGTASSGAGALGYEWRQVSGPAAGLTRSDRAAATVVLFGRGTYDFELVVSDVAGTSVPARVRVEARARGASLPLAVPSAPATAKVGEVVPLDGRASTGAMSFRWTQVDGPWVAVEQGPVGSFRPVAPGVYGFELEVDDGAVRSAPARVSVVVFQNGTEN